MHTSHALEPSLRARFGRPIWTVVIIVLLIVSMQLAGCRKAKRLHPSKQTVDTNTDQGLFGSSKNDSIKASFTKAHMTWNDSKGRRVWDTQFKEALLSSTGDNSSVELHGVQGVLFEDGKEASKLTAQRVVADGKNKEIRAFGGVKLVSLADGAVMNADQLTWKSAEGKVFGSGKIRMVRKNLSVSATGFSSDVGLHHAQFLKGTLEVK